MLDKKLDSQFEELFSGVHVSPDLQALKFQKESTRLHFVQRLIEFGIISVYTDDAYRKIGLLKDKLVNLEARDDTKPNNATKSTLEIPQEIEHISAYVIKQYLSMLRHYSKLSK